MGPARPSLEEDDAVDRVDDDISRLESKIESADLSEELRDAAERNLEQIRVDVGRFAKANGNEKRKLKEAVQLRMKALHMQLEEGDADESSDDVFAAKADNVVLMAEKVKRALPSMHLSRKAVEIAKDDISKLEEDARELRSGGISAVRKANLVKAMKLRNKALHSLIDQ